MPYDKAALAAWKTLDPELRAQMDALNVGQPLDDDSQATALYPPEQIAWHAECIQKRDEDHAPPELPPKPKGTDDVAAFLDEVLVYFAGAETQQSLAHRTLVVIAMLAPRYLEYKTMAQIARSANISKQRLSIVAKDARESLNLPEPPAALVKRTKRTFKVNYHPTHDAVATEMKLVRAWQNERALTIKAESQGVNVPLLSRRFRHYRSEPSAIRSNYVQIPLNLPQK